MNTNTETMTVEEANRTWCGELLSQAQIRKTGDMYCMRTPSRRIVLKTGDLLVCSQHAKAYKRTDGAVVIEDI